MIYAEASFPFPGTTPHHFQHIAARDEALRLQRKQAGMCLLSYSPRGTRL
jgi:hypothetical protein